MTGPDHFREADLILTGDPCSYGCPHSGCEHEASMIARAQVHASLRAARKNLGSSLDRNMRTSARRSIPLRKI